MAATQAEMKWYVVQTHSGFEAKAKTGLAESAKQSGLEASLGDIIIPMENVVEVKKGEKAQRARKFFPGYMLVQMRLDERMWHAVKNTARIIGCLGYNDKRPLSDSNPPPLREDEVARIRGQMEEGLKAPKTAVSFSEGDQVRVVDGPFKNFSGTVEESNPDKAKVRVLVSIFGRATPVELDFVQVEPAS